MRRLHVHLQPGLFGGLFEARATGGREEVHLKRSQPRRWCILASLCAAACAGSDGGLPVEPEFWSDVAPLVTRECVACHRRGGAAPFPFETYADVRALGPAIERVVTDGSMPPWLPADGVPLAGRRKLAEAERRTIIQWVRDGMPEGSRMAGDSIPVPVDGWALGTPDISLTSPDSFPVPASGPEIFRNLVIPFPGVERRWVSAVEIRFDRPDVVHHAMLTVDATRSSRRMDRRDSLPGFDGMFGTTEAAGPSGFLLGWTPGREARRFPPDLAWELPSGSDLVVQLHIRPNGEQASLAPRVGLHMADGPPSREPFTVRLGVQDIDVPPESTFVGRDSYTLPVPIDLRGLYPHAHYLGRSIRLDAVSPAGDTVTVFHIPAWDFDWQDAYRLADPMPLPAGTELVAEFTYDNTSANPSNPHQPPRRVTYGPRSDDEMGELWLQVVPQAADDLAILARHHGRKQLASKIAGWEYRLTVDPEDASALAGLGTIEQARGEHERAVQRFERALESQPDFVAARYNLALSLESLGRAAEAAEQYRRVTDVDPDYADAHNNLGLLAARSGRLAEAIASFDAALEADSNHARALNNLGNLRRVMGEVDSAERLLLRALSVGPEDPSSRRNLALLAFGFATHPSPERRDGPRAISLIERIGPAGDSDPWVLEARAAAEAELGRLDRALQTARRALARLPATPGAASLAPRLELAVERYQAGQALRLGER